MSTTVLKRFLFGFLLLAPLITAAQDITLSSHVEDLITHEPLSFASVLVKGKAIGTITNVQGDFDFHIPLSYSNETIVVTMLGYRAAEYPVSALINKGVAVIPLEQTAVVLSEIVVRDSVSNGDIFRAAIAKITTNYPMEPYLMEGFYRDTKKLGGTYISVLEAAIKIYDEDYIEPRNKFKLRERVALLEVRRSLGYSSKFTSYFDEDNLLEDLLLNNSIRYRQFPDDDVFFNTIKRLKNSYYNGREVYVLTQQNGYYLKVYIDTETYAIIHLEYDRAQNEKWGKRRGLDGRFVNLRKTIDFKEYLGKWYLNYMTVDSKINWYDGKTNTLKFETELHQQLLINRIIPNTAQKIGTTEKMKSYGLQFQDLPYNKKFWDNYNVIKASPLDKQIVDDLEKELPLEKQFEN